MPRRSRPPRREIESDIRYHSVMVARFINKLMLRGKKSTAERILYDAFDIIENRVSKKPLEVFEQAVGNATPTRCRLRSGRRGDSRWPCVGWYRMLASALASLWPRSSLLS
jgi:small subunit ribosomal protein S7